MARSVTRAARHALNQHILLCESLPSNDGKTYSNSNRVIARFLAFRQVSPICAASIGQHTRHVLDHFSSLCGSVHTDLSVDSALVRYDSRARDTATENDRDAAIKTAKDLQLQIEELNDQHLQIRVCAACSLRLQKLTSLRQLAIVATRRIHAYDRRRRDGVRFHRCTGIGVLHAPR
jgi:hypothetical protein